MGKFAILKPIATRNYVTNPSFQSGLGGWIPAWAQEATFEKGMRTDYSVLGFDSIAGAGAAAMIASGRSAIRGKYGIEAPLVNGADKYGLLSDPANETIITLEWYLNTNNLLMTAGDSFNIIEGRGTGTSARTFLISITNVGGDYRVSAQASNDGGGANTIAQTHSFTPGDVLKLRLYWAAATAPAANDGFVFLFINDGLIGSATGLDNDTYTLTDIRFGPQGVDVGTSGTFYGDNARWARGDVPFTGSSIEQAKERARFGTDSLKVYTDGNSVNEGPYFRVSSLDGINSVATASAYVRGNGKVRIRIKDGLSGDEFSSMPVNIHDDWWQRIEVLGRSGGSNDIQVYIETAETSQEVIFYVDGVQLELQGEVTTYCDGEQEGCRWEGVFHASESTRPEKEASGGTFVPLDDDEQEIYVTVAGGVGVPPVRQNFQRTAQTPGGFYDNTAIDERVIALTIWTVPKGAQDQTGNSLKLLHELRQTLIDLFKPDVAPNYQELTLRYTDNGRSLFIKVRYEAGLDFSGDMRNKWTNTIPLRLLALQPFWEEDDQEVALLDSEAGLGIDFDIFGRIDGEWGRVFNGTYNAAGTFSGGVYAINADQNGRIYVGGDFFRDIDGNSLRRFCYANDDFSYLIEAATGLNQSVRDIVAHPNGKIYACGGFTADNAGNAFDRIVEYDPDTDTFSALAGGIDDGTAYGMFVAPNGDIYVVGNFTTVDGSPANRIAYWDGGSWHTVGDIDAELSITGDLNAVLVISPDELYVVGRDSAPGGSTSPVFMKWDGSNWAATYSLSRLSGGPPDGVSILRDITDGNIVFSARFVSDTTGNNTVGLFKYNGSATNQLGSDLLGIDFPAINIKIKQDSNGNIIVFGSVDQVGSLEKVSSPFLIWNGSSFVYSDFESAQNNSIGSMYIAPNDDIYAGVQNNFDDANAAGIVHVPNIGTADTPAIITIFGSGRAVWLENQTTGQRVYLNYTLQLAETLELDFRDGVKTVKSNYAGNVPNAILPNSDDLELAAGRAGQQILNKIAFLMVDEVTPVAQLRYTPRHWSIDGVS